MCGRKPIPTQMKIMRGNPGKRPLNEGEPHPTAPRSPWQNAYAERLIGSVRRECLDRVVVTGEAHLRRTLQRYADYYNRARTHRSLRKDCPMHRPVQAIGAISSSPVLGGLHHVYSRT